MFTVLFLQELAKISPKGCDGVSSFPVFIFSPSVSLCYSFAIWLGSLVSAYSLFGGFPSILVHFIFLSR